VKQRTSQTGLQRLRKKNGLEGRVISSEGRKEEKYQNLEKKKNSEEGVGSEKYPGARGGGAGGDKV